MTSAARIKNKLLAGALLLLAVPALALESSGPAVLKVRVNAPPSWNILLEDRVNEVFADRIRDAIARTGSRLGVDEIRPVEDPGKTPYLLTVSVTEWRLNRLGNIECTFDAELQTPAGQRRFGGYAATIPRWLDNVRGQIANSALEPAASDASIGHLGRDLLNSGLLPGSRDSARDRMAANT